MFKQKTIKREKKLQKTKIKDYHTLNSNEIWQKFIYIQNNIILIIL